MTALTGARAAQPAITPIHDLVIKNDDLGAGYAWPHVLDLNDVPPLRQFADSVSQEILFIRPRRRIVCAFQPQKTRHGWCFAGQNPPNGAVIILPEAGAQAGSQD